MIKKNTNTNLTIDALKQGRITLRMIGNTPIIFNRMAEKAKRDLLIGAGRKTAAQKKEIKHNPEFEFRSSIHKMVDGDTLLGFPAAGVKGAMATAALETTGVNKTSVNRLIFLPQQKVSIWGTPKLYMDVVRSSDMNKTPDIRTRAIVNEWCAEVDIAFVTPTLSQHSIVSLLQNAGMICGIGDNRQEKGKGNFGSWFVDFEGNDQFKDVWETRTKIGRKAQEKAMKDIIINDEETQELYDFYKEEVIRRAA